MVKDDSGQFLLLTSIVVAIGLVILLVFMNQSSLAGHASSESIMNFPKSDIRDIKSDVVNQVYFTAKDYNNITTLSGNGRSVAYNSSIKIYGDELKSLYMEKGANVYITNLGCYYNLSLATDPANQTLERANVSFHYDDSETSYDEVDTINII